MGTFSDIMSKYMFTGPGMAPVYSPNPTKAERQEYNKNMRRRAYFDGIKGMSAGARADWEKRYLKELSGKSPDMKDEFFRNTVFRELFENSDDSRKQKIWNNRNDMSFRQRDIYVAREIADDYTKKGGPGRGQPDIVLNRQAMNLLSYESERQADKYKEYLHSLDGSDRQNMLKELDEVSKAISPYYKKYYGTDKLNLNDEDKINLIANFQAWNEIGGNSFAQKALGEYYQNIVANNQSLWEKTINSGAQFVDSATGMLIRAAGMIGAMATIGKEEGEGYWQNVIDNEVTRYGDRVATTNSYDPEEQKKLEELGLSDNPILNTVAQQESILSLNTPFELFGQYGFTTASTILSFGGSAVVNALAKGAAWTAKAATTAKGLNTTARGVKFLRGVSRAKDIGNFAVVGGVASIEGGMNAAQTKHTILNELNADIDSRYRQKAQKDIADQVRKDPQGAARLLRAEGYDIPERATATVEGKHQNPYSEQEINQMIELLQNNENAVSAALQKYSKSMSDDRVAAEESANTAMYTDFIGNSIINGFIHSTLQSSLNAPSIQNTLRKYHLAKSPLDRAGIDVTGQGGRWVANARKYSRLDAFGDRLKESLGEGLEEYKQDLSSAYAEGYAKDKYTQYLNNKYAGGSMEDALDNDIISSMAAGFKALGETALSKEALKDGLYGGLSTFMGGLNVNSHILNGTRGGNRKEGESFLSYMGRKSPIGWRSGIGPLINSSEADAVNARREEIAKNINDFFSNPEYQEAYFNIKGTSEWMRQLETAAENKDQMEVRNSKLGVLFSNVITLNSLRGTGYYDMVIASLQAKANLSEENLQDENSVEAKLVAMYKQDALNRGQEITDEEALQSIKSSASKMLDTIDRVNKETKEVEKLYSDELDKDVKAGLVFQRLSIEDAKNRINQLNEELTSVSAALANESDNGIGASSQALNRPAKILISRFGSLDKATTRLKELDEDKKKLKETINAVKSDQKSAVTTEEKRGLALAREMSESALKEIKREHRELKSLIDNYSSFASTEVDSNGNLIPTNQHVISALDIMNLDAQSRATMLDPNNRENYSQEQQAEIDKVNRIGVQTYQDFASKIQDSSRLAFSYEASMQRQLDMMQNPQLFTREANRIKSEAQERLLRKKYNYLLDLEEQGDYAAFARELDKINDSNDRVAVNAAMNLLRDSDSAFFKEYNTERERLGNLYRELENKQIEAYNSLDDNQKSVFADTLRYLSNKGIIDINDTNGAVYTLAEQDEDGNSLFEQYVNEVNSNVPDDVRSVFTSVEEAIQVYKDVVSEYNSALQEKANNAKETPVTPTTPEQSAPPKVPSAGESSLFKMGTSTIEEGTKRSQEADQEGVIEDPVTEAYKENSGQEIANLSKLAANSINNASSTTSNQESRTLALDEIRRLSDVKFDNADDYVDAILQSANKLDLQSKDDGDNEGRAASLLRAVATRVRAKSDERKRKSEEGKAKDKAPQDKKASFAERKLTSPIRSAVNVNAALMDTIPIAWIRQNYPNSPLVKYYDNYRIEEFLETDFMSGNPTIMFISDPQLAEAVKADMESRNLKYTEDSIPLIAVVEVPTGGITIKVNNEDKHFQPIGIMPRTGHTNSNGSNRLAVIRSLINNQELGQLIKDADGNIVTTTIGGNVIAEAPKQLPVTEPNRSAISLQINDLDEKEKRELQALSKPDRRKNPIYWRIKQAFLKKLAIATPEGKGKYLYYALPNLKGQVIDVRVFTTPVNLTRDRNSNRLISELFNSNEVSAALNSNSRISRAAKELKKFFEKSFDTSEMYFEADDAGNIVPTESTAKKLNALSEQLTKSIGNFLSLPTRDGWKYVISPTSEVIGDGRRMFTLSLTNNEGSQIELGKVTNGQMQENTQFNILKNLIMDGSSVRMVNNRESFVKWNVPYSDVQNMNSNKAAKDNISDIYDDGILDFSKDSLRYHIKGLSINSPFTMQGEANYTKQDEVSSPTNAQPTTPLNQPVVAANDQVTTSKGTIVDSESGAVLGGESTPTTQSNTDVKPIVDSIVANSKIIQLSEDGKHYINTRTGKKYARVTSIIQADEHSDGRFDPNSPWITPSTNIGTGMDELVRDFFAGNLKDNYPNIGKNQIDLFVSQLQGLKNSLDAQGLTVVPRDVVAIGSIEATDSKGKKHTIDVAGTLDLLAYDGKGNFYIFDMKTHRSANVDGKIDKWRRQLTLYKTFLESQYGIKVKSLNIIPIKVEYPTPKGVGNSTNEYTVKEGNQLLLNGKEFTGANPKLGNTIPLNPIELNVLFDKLTEEEKRQSLTKEEQEILKNAPRDSQGRLLAPNGKVSNLTEKQYAQVRTKAFKKWFGDWEKEAKFVYDLYSEEGNRFLSTEERNKIIDDYNSGKDIIVYAASNDIESLLKGNDFRKTSKSYDLNTRDGVLYTSYTLNYAKNYGNLYANSNIDIDKIGLVKITLNKNNTTNGVSFTDSEVRILSNNVIKTIEKLNVPKNTTKRQIHTRNYKNVSKVVDENGEPLVVYHATNKIFNTYKERDGIHFGSYNTALGVANEKFDPTFDTIEEAQASIAKGKFRINQVFLNIRNPKQSKDLGTGWKQLIAEGFDGGLYMAVEGDTSFVVFDPNQIKSATDNSGAFSNTNDDIYDTVSSLISENDASVNQTSPETTTPTETQESEIPQQETKSIEKIEVKEESDGSFVDPTVGLKKTKSQDLRRKKKGKGGAVKKLVGRLTPVPAKYQWGKFEGVTTSDGDTIDAKLATSNLEKAGYTEESWNQLSDEEMQHELDCKGV